MRISSRRKRPQTEIDFWAAALFGELTPLPAIDLTTAESAKRAIEVLNKHQAHLERMRTLLNRLQDAPPPSRLNDQLEFIHSLGSQRGAVQSMRHLFRE